MPRFCRITDRLVCFFRKPIGNGSFQHQVGSGRQGPTAVTGNHRGLCRRRCGALAAGRLPWHTCRRCRPDRSGGPDGRGGWWPGALPALVERFGCRMPAEIGGGRGLCRWRCGAPASGYHPRHTRRRCRLVFVQFEKASWGTSTVPRLRIRFLPSFCFSSSFFFRVMSPP